MKPFLYELTSSIADSMIKTHSSLKLFYTEGIIFLKQEEEKFLKLLNNKVVSNLINKPPKKMSGKDIFQLVTSFGIPLLYIKKIGSAKKINLDLSKFDILWKNHQKISRSQTHKFIEDWKILKLVSKPATIFEEKAITILDAKILGIFIQGKCTQKAKNTRCWIVTDKTPFYAEKGGQIFDTGLFKTVSSRGKIVNVQLNNKQQVLHFAEITGELQIGDFIELKINNSRRNLIRNNHSATHLLHSVLRNEITKQIHQTGSFNNDEYLRLDFYAPQKITNNQLLMLEKKVNYLIKQAIPPKIIWSDLASAKKNNALAFFEETYDTKKVRIVQFSDYSIELCGGTHVSNTKNIEQFIITKFETISQNNYRIYALTTHLKVSTALQELQNTFEIWCQKNQIKNYIAFYNSKPLKKTALTAQLTMLECYKKIKCAYDSLISLQTLIKEFKSIWMELSVQKDSANLKQIVATYKISPENFYQKGIKTFLFHVIQNSSNLSDEFLWLLFDKVQKNSHALICLLMPISIKRFRFVFCDFRKNVSIDWKNLFIQEFTSNIKIGGKKNKLQGIFCINSPKVFKNFIFNNF